MADDRSPRSSLDVPTNGGSYALRRGSDDLEPPPYDGAERGRGRTAEQRQGRDPRSSSTQSLRPSEAGRDGRRTLLLIYIHGFLGNEMSFQSFPAHVHNLLSILVAKTHVLHTKMYPRYKSRKAIEHARDEFSEWLLPNETPETDVVLLGHSMGGILAAEVALLPPLSPATGQPFRHRILGTISFDTPYLGMHPGVIMSGISSLFRPAPKPATFEELTQAANSAIGSQSTTSLSTEITQTGSEDLSTNQSTISLASVPTNDPYYDPPFPNDRRLAERPGWSGIIHFISKHSDGLTNATKQYFISHLEFGGCLADYPALKRRYTAIRALEDVDELSNQSAPGYKQPVRRVRFVNYWTASTGFIKPKSKSPRPKVDENGHLMPMETEMKDMSLTNSKSRSRSHTPTPSISVEEYSDEGVKKQKVELPPDAAIGAAAAPEMGASSGVQEEEPRHLGEMQHIDSMPIEDDDEYTTPAPADDSTHKEDEADRPKSAESDLQLPPLPPIPQPPPPIDLNIYTDKDARKLAEKEHKRLQKAYQQAVKNRDSAIKDRKKLIEKREKKARQTQGKLHKEREKKRIQDEKEEWNQRLTINPGQAPSPARPNTQPAEKPKKDKKFCVLPPEVNGKRDKCWIRIYMEGVDEVGAHCGLFFPGPQYESLVGDVAARIEEWVGDDATKRMILEAEGGAGGGGEKDSFDLD